MPDDATAVTAARLRQVVERIIAAGHWREGDTLILIVADSGYDVARIAHELRGLPVMVAGRVRSDRVFRFPAVNAYRRQCGRPSRHGTVFKLADAEPKPVWIWASTTGADAALIDVLWQAYLR